MVAKSNEKTISSLDTAFRILELIEERDGVKPAEIQDELSFSKSNVHYYLKTLSKHQFITKQGGEYYLGLRFLHYGGIAVERQRLIGSIEPIVDDLATKTQQTALIAVEESGKSQYIYQSYGDESKRTNYFIGQERHLHCTAFGKAILAYLPDDQRDQILEQHGLPEFTERTISSLHELNEELREVRLQEFAYSDGEYNPAVRSLAVPVWNRDKSDLLGSIGIIGSEQSIDDPGSRIKAQRFEQSDVNVVKRMAKITRNKLV